MDRRKMIKNVGGATAVTALGASFSNLYANGSGNSKLKGNIHHSVCRWVYSDIPLDKLATACIDMGIKAIDLLDEKDWAFVNKAGLKCSMGNVTDYGIPKGFNRLEYHEKLISDYTSIIPRAAAAGVQNLICFSGNSAGQSDNDGLINCAIGLRKIMPVAEKHGVNIIMELLNTNMHEDYQCNKTSWGAALCEMVGSERFKLLYDIFHMQIMEGNIIDTINKYSKYIGHIHTGGVPGRHDIDETQELYYPAIMRAIVKTGYKGYVAHEYFSLQENKLEALRNGVLICDV